MKKLKYGLAVNDYKGTVKFHDGRILQSYKSWQNMLMRCYSNDYEERRPTYKDCSVCDEWKRFSNFKEWFDKHYVEGWQLDKDLLVKGNKVYSPDTCCFLPIQINTFLTQKSNTSRGLPTGVFHSENKEKFIVYIREYGKRKYLGTYLTKHDAESTYKSERSRYAKSLAERYKNDLCDTAYNALINI